MFGQGWGQQAGCGGQMGGQGFGGQGVQMPQTIQARPQMGAPMQQQAAGGEVGAAVQFTITGCVNETVGPIIRGDYTRFCVNHGKPAFKKAAAPGGMEVMMYFWDERDGAAASGWWLGPKLGSDHVWGFHPNKNVQTPPTSGWQVPHSGPADPTCILRVQQQQGMGGGMGGGMGKGMGAMGAMGAMGGMGQQQPQVIPPAKGGWQQQQQQQQQQQGGWQQQQQGGWQQQQQAAAQQAAQLKQQQMAQQQAAQKARMEQVKKQQEELRKKQEEAKKKQQEELAAKRKEQAACAAIRQKLVKLKTSTPENYEAMEKEYQTVLAEKLPECGSMQAQMTNEGEKAIEAAKKRLEDIAERKRKSEELAKENERKRAEAKEKCEAATAELETLIEAAEAASTKLKESVEPLGDADVTEAKLAKTTKAAEAASETAAEAVKAITEFMSTKNSELSPPQPLPAETKQAVQKLRAKLEEVKKGNVQANAKCKTGKATAEKKIAAKLVTKKIDALFTKYDKDKDGLLNVKEMLAYAQGEFKFTVPKDSADTIVKNLAGGGKGVKKDSFQKLKVQVGIAREKARDTTRKVEREAKEKRLAELKEKIQVKIDAAEKPVDSAEEEVAAVEKQALPLGAKAKTMASTEILEQATEIEAAVAKAKETVASAKEVVAALSEDVDSDLKAWLAAKVSKNTIRLSRMDPRLTKCGNVATRMRDEGKKKDAAELVVMQKQALAMLKHHQTAKSIKNDALLSAMSKGDSIAEKDFVAYLGKCEKPPAEEGKEEAKDLSADDLKRVFASLDEDSTGSIPKELFMSNIRVFMKVTKETAITEGFDIKESKSLRRLEVGEVVEILEGPTKEDSVEVMRVLAKTMSDGVEGWITTEGNKGTSFLAPGGNVFKVVKDTIMTAEFDLEGSKDSMRKLKVGELVEVREWPKKEEKSGLTRMKCKVRTDGLVGYVTTVGNTGNLFLEVV